MSTVILNFESREVVAKDRNAAVEIVENDLYKVMGDATQAFKNWKSNQTTISDRDIKQFMLDYLAKKSKSVEGVGFTITLESAQTDTRERPWTVVNVKNEDGARKPQRVFNITNLKTGVIDAKVYTNKAEAIAKMKELIGENHVDYDIVTGWEVKNEKQRVVAHGKYTPSKGTKNGRYLAFGIKA